MSPKVSNNTLIPITETLLKQQYQALYIFYVTSLDKLVGGICKPVDSIIGIGKTLRISYKYIIKY